MVFGAGPFQPRWEKIFNALGTTLDDTGMWRTPPCYTSLGRRTVQISEGDM